jgi:pimeloyl-ACP methyl ester carboxylesterase
MTTFALLHGGAHGGWCWDQVVPILHDLGHQTVAPDLPMDEPVGVEVWAQVVVDALEEARADTADVVGVAHSLGGLALPVLATMIPLRRMVFLAALVPMPGQGLFEYAATQEGMFVTAGGDSTTDDQGRTNIGWEMARQSFYQDCPLEVALAAYQRLRPLTQTSFLEPCPLKAWPDVPSSYILCQDDHACGPDWSRRVARERLGVAAIELPGGHSPFLTRPGELVEALLAAIDS